MESARTETSGRTMPVRLTLRKAVEGSLKRLRLDRIDVYQLHTPDPVVPFDASVETLANMQSEGKIPVSRVVQRNRGAHRGAQGKSCQSCRSRIDTVLPIANGQRRGLLRTQRNRLHPVVPAGSRNRGGRLLERIAKARQVKPIQVALAWVAQAVSDDAAHPRDYVDCAS